MVMPFARRTLLQALGLSIVSPTFAPQTFAAKQTVGAESTTPSEVTHRTLMVSGLKFHIAEAGQGRAPLVLLCHGWPECWYSWRHQLPALADAGFRAIAPDLRGFGETDAPDDISAYTIVHNVGDMVQLVSALGEQQAVIIGHDWGAFVAWACALLRPDMFRAVVAVSTPYIERGPSPPLKALRDAGITMFYWQYFQTPGVAEAEFERDVDHTMRAELYGTGKSLMLRSGQGFLTGVSIPEQLPSWLTEEDIAYYVDTYKRTGFRNSLSLYRNIDRNWELSAAWDRMRIRQPAYFIAGTEDLAINSFGSKALLMLPNTVPGLKGSRLIPGAGHFVQEERAAEVNAAVIDFLHTV